MHPDVVLVNITSSLSLGATDGKIDLRWNAFGKTLGQPDFGPLPAAPIRAVLQTLFESRKRKIQKYCKGNLVLKKIVEHMGRWIISRKCLIKGKHRPKIKVHLLAELPVDLMHMAGELFQQILEAIKYDVQGRLITGKICRDEFFQSGSVSIFRAPEFRHLLQSALDAGPLAFSILFYQLSFQLLVCSFHPCRNRDLRGRLRRSRHCLLLRLNARQSKNADDQQDEYSIK